jgi:undecaprenyl-diphosphatase
MTLFQALILGIVQGLTEFLPISSSAHLVIVPFLLNWHIPNPLAFSFDVLVQVGTLVAVIVYFWKDLWAILKAVVIGILKRSACTPGLADRAGDNPCWNFRTCDQKNG